MVFVRKPLLFFAIALVAVNAQCIAACSTAACAHAPASVPPCHRHHHRVPELPAATRICTDAAWLAARSSGAQPADQLTLAGVQVSTAAADTPVLMPVLTAAMAPSPPLLTESYTSTVLQI